jgi:hypothetical protein
MKTFEEIKTNFEHRSFLVRSDFINEYDFKDSHSEYYHNFIIKAKNIKDHMYLSDLIDLAGLLNIYDEELRIRYYKYLFSKQHYLVKLAVLDYFKYCRRELLPESYESDLILFVKQKIYSILKAQAWFNLIYFGSTEVDFYLDQLRKLLTQCSDWRVFHRILMNIKYVKVESRIKESICRHIVFLSKEKYLGKGVEALLKELCN